MNKSITFEVVIRIHDLKGAVCTETESKRGFNDPVHLGWSCQAFFHQGDGFGRQRHLKTIGHKSRCTFAEDMMAKYLKTAEERPAEDLSLVRDTVRKIIERIKQDGEAAVRFYSEKFDHWSPKAFRVSEEDIRSARRKF